MRLKGPRCSSQVCYIPLRPTPTPTCLSSNLEDDLQTPIPDGTESISRVDDFLFMRNDNSWFGNVLKIMNVYSTYFRGSASLGECSAVPTLAPLIINKLVYGSTPLAANNPINRHTQAFPQKGVFASDYVHETTDTALSPANSYIAISSKTNIKTDLPNLGQYSNLGNIDLTRTGPYWAHTPVKRLTTPEKTWKSLAAIVSERYALTRPPPLKD
uniref:IAA-leucine resistant 2-like n=1 Tax=Diabrotica virgifera virgifera TaxID=50390 RepID=A0A6P7GS13_DIAVI